MATWTASSWGHLLPDGRTRADVTADTLQRLADLAADAERRQRRTVPRLDHYNELPVGTGLADQLAVLTCDAAASPDPAVGRQVTALLDALRARLRPAPGGSSWR